MSGLAASSVYAVELLAEFIRRGVQDIVVCPGSRSQALALAAAAAEQAGAVRVHVRGDERSAGFFALGVARETGLPAPVIVTSGSAVANLHPAVLEAHEARVPMVLLTADRPAELRGVRSNQTTHQAGLFGRAARLAVDVSVDDAGAGPQAPGTLAPAALAAALGSRGAAPAGPVQLNLAFREPLSGSAGYEQVIIEGFRAAASEGSAARDARNQIRTDADEAVGVDAGAGGAAEGWADAQDGVKPRTVSNQMLQTTYQHRDDALAVVIAGESAGPEAEAFAHAAGLPLLAEVVSGARFGREAIVAYAKLIADAEIGGLTERAIVFGHPTLTRQVQSLLTRDDVEVVVVDPHRDTEHYNPGGRARIVARATVAPEYDPRSMRRWLGAWISADRSLTAERSTVHEPDLEAALETGYKERNRYARAELASLREPITRDMLGESLWRATWPHDRLVVAASRLVRSLDALAAPRRVPVHANRGVAGIDGTVATALGVAASSEAAGVTRVLIGDLALLHDVSSLNIPEIESRPRVQLFVGNDGGGTMFDTLEVAGGEQALGFDRVMYTPQQVQLEALARAYGWAYRRIETRGELNRLLTEPVHGPELVEVPLER